MGPFSDIPQTGRFFGLRGYRILSYPNWSSCLRRIVMAGRGSGSGVSAAGRNRTVPAWGLSGSPFKFFESGLALGKPAPFHGTAINYLVCICTEEIRRQVGMMLSAEEFRAHAEECRRMAQSTKSKEECRVWGRMADRWLLCARLVEEEQAVPERPAPQPGRAPRKVYGVTG
jgi:hypothetical protein